MGDSLVSPTWEGELDLGSRRVRSSAGLGFRIRLGLLRWGSGLGSNNTRLRRRLWLRLRLEGVGSPLSYNHRVGLRLRLEGGAVGLAIPTLDNKACEGRVW